MFARGDGKGEAGSRGEAQAEQFTEAVRKGAYIDTAMHRTLAAVVQGRGVDCATSQTLYDEVWKLRHELTTARAQLRAESTQNDYITKFEWLHTELGCHIMRDSVMSERQHTPGPWVKRQFPTAANACLQYWVMDSIPDVDGKVVANSICKVMPTNPDEEANADLIAAAPDLLEACEYVRRFGFDGEVYEEGHRHHGMSVSAFVEAAIAKAKGNAE